MAPSLIVGVSPSYRPSLVVILRASHEQDAMARREHDEGGNPDHTRGKGRGQTKEWEHEH